MELTPPDLSPVFDIFKIPSFIQPWADRFLNTADVDLILSFADQTIQTAHCVEHRVALEKGVRRGLIHPAASGGYQLSDFHSRFEIWALFEGWQDIPDPVRLELNRWELNHYIQAIGPQVETLKTGAIRDPQRLWSTYLLWHEAQRLIDLADSVYLWPCNCRHMMGACDKSRFTCLRFDNEQGIGWAISRHRAKQIAREAHRAGLMQCGEIGFHPDGRLKGALCNCCADCCYPHQAAAQLGIEKLWPTSRYQAHYDPGACNRCGRCVRRCPFDAFERQRRKDRLADDSAPDVLFHPRRCRGCGLCAAGCRQNAIEMKRTGESFDEMLKSISTRLI